MKKSFTTELLVKVSMVAAIYIVSTVMLGDLGYSFIQFRIAEVLNFLAFIDPYYVIGLTIGCAISNLFGYGIIDAIVGGLATLFITYWMYKSKNLFVASLLPMLNGPIIATELLLLYEDIPWLVMAGSIAASQFVIMVVIGYPFFRKLIKDPNLIKMLKIDKNNTKISF